MGKSAVSSSGMQKQRPTAPQPSDNSDTSVLTQPNFLFNPARQDSISSILNNYLTSAPTASYINSKHQQTQLQQPQQNVDASYPSYYLNTRESNMQQQPQVQQQQQQPIMRPRGDSIFLPPPINSQMRPNVESGANYDPNQVSIPAGTGGSNSGNSYSLRSNSIFSSLIQIPGSSGNSISEQTPSNAPTNSKHQSTGTRQRQQSILPGGGEQISAEDLENIMNKESLGNLLAWSQQNQQDTKAGSATPSRSKYGSIDMSMWNDGTLNNPNAFQGSISGFNGSLTEFIQGMISNGSIDFSNMSNEQRRDSILKIINDLQGTRQQRTPSDNSSRYSTLTNASDAGKTKLREDIFEKEKDKDKQNTTSTTKIDDATNNENQKLAVPNDKTSPASSMSSRTSKYNEEPQSPKTSPSIYNARLNQGQSSQYPPQNQQFNPQAVSQAQIPPQRLFQNFQQVSNQYGFNVPNPQYNNSVAPNVTMRNNQQYPNQEYHQQYSGQMVQTPVAQQQQQKHDKKKRGKKPDRKSEDNINNLRKSEGLLDDKNLVPAQQYVKSEDGRPLLGATKIDQLMLVIQARDKGITNQIQQAPDGSIMGSPNFALSKDKAELEEGVLPRPISLVGGVDRPNKLAAEFAATSRAEKHGLEDGEADPLDPKSKKHKNQQCPYCFKYFTQTTHLEVHIRSHIGFKPFECSYCLKRFTQGGNLRTHMRLHTGEKPFTCDVCNRSFSRKGNLAAHKLTHENLKPYECKLDGCDKSFTQLGNLKSHQNRFHLGTLNALTQKLAELSGPQLNNLPKQEKDLLNYFKELYKNSNKGIRGRGKQQKQNAEANMVVPTGHNDDKQLMQPPPAPPARQSQQYSPLQPLDYMNSNFRDANRMGLNGYQN